MSILQGPYSVTITDGDNGCTAESTFNLNQDASVPTANIASDVVELTCDTLAATLDASASTGTGTLSYLWSTTETTSSISVNTAGPYSVTITDGDNGCTAESTFNLTQDINNPIANIDSDVIELTCDTLAATLDASASTGTGTLSYLWSTTETTSSISVNTAGPYSVTITDGDNGCTAESTFNLNQDASMPTASIDSDVVELTCDTLAATLDASASTGTGTLSYLWSTTETTNSISVNTAGPYSVTITDGDNGCTAESTFNLAQDIDNPTADIVATATELSCTTTTVTLDATGSTVKGTASYNWTGGATTETINVNAPGTYFLTVTDSDNGCTDITSIVISQITDLTASAVATPVSCNGNDDGQITLTVNDGKAPFLFDWDNDETNDNDDLQNIASLSPGIYNVTITDANGCTTNTSAEVTEPDELSLSTSTTDLSCNGAGTGDISLTITGGTPVFRIDWDNNGIGDTDDDQNLTDLVAGTYNVTVTDASGCTATASATLTEPAPLDVKDYIAEVCSHDAGSVDLDSYYANITTETGTIVWYTDAAKLNPVPGTPPVVSVNDGDQYYFEFTETATSCKVDGVVDFEVDISFCILPVELIFFKGERRIAMFSYNGLRNQKRMHLILKFRKVRMGLITKKSEKLLLQEILQL